MIENLKQYKNIKKVRQTQEYSPMLATLTEQRFDSKEWLYERKLDGERCLLYIKKNDIQIVSRNKKKQDDFYPEIHQALTELSYHMTLDCELVVFDGQVTSFAKLQNRMHVENPSDALIKKYPVYAYIFDILSLDNYDLTNLSLRERKKILKKCINFKNPLRFVPHRNETGKSYFKKACQKGWEGLIAKKADSPYQQTRSKLWLKFKCVNQQELVICGYSKPQGERIRFGALLVTA